jgi:hypothetical protein
VADALDALLDEYDTWLRVERGLAPNSLAAYRRDLRRYAAYLRHHGETDPAAVDEAVVVAYVEELKQARTDDGRPRYKESSIARALAAVRSFHRFCVEEGLLAVDPSEEIGGPRGCFHIFTMLRMLGPTIATNSPSAILKSAPRNACTWPSSNSFCSPTASKTGAEPVPFAAVESEFNCAIAIRPADLQGSESGPATPVDSS